MSNVPEIRFKGFTNPWEQRKLGDIGTTFTGLSGKTKDDFGHGKAHFVTYMNVFQNPVAKPDKVECVEIDNSQNEVQYGDVFFTTSSETPEEVGMSSVWLENTENTYLNSFCFGYRPTEKINPYYTAYMLRSKVVRKNIVFLAQGISRYNISKNKVMEISIPLPNLDEQKHIGTFFSNIDNLITLHQRKLDKIKILKKSMLEKMFPKNGENVPEIRFKGFTNPWEQRKLGELGEFTSNGVDKKVYPNEKIVNLLNYMDVYNRRSINAQNRNQLMQVSAKDTQIANNNILKNDVFFTPTSETADDIGHAMVIEETLENTVYSYHLMRFRPHENVFYSIFPNYCFDTKQVRQQMSIMAQGVQRFVLSKSQFESIEIMLPHIAEQARISECLRNLDNLITLHQRKLELLINIKKSMLEKMFV